MGGKNAQNNLLNQCCFPSLSCSVCRHTTAILDLNTHNIDIRVLKAAAETAATDLSSPVLWFELIWSTLEPHLQCLTQTKLTSMFSHLQQSLLKLQRANPEPAKPIRFRVRLRGDLHLAWPHFCGFGSERNKRERLSSEMRRAANDVTNSAAHRSDVRIVVNSGYKNKTELNFCCCIYSVRGHVETHPINMKVMISSTVGGLWATYVYPVICPRSPFPSAVQKFLFSKWTELFFSIFRQRKPQQLHLPATGACMLSTERHHTYI